MSCGSSRRSWHTVSGQGVLAERGSERSAGRQLAHALPPSLSLPASPSGSAKDLICTHFMDGMSELAIAYILQGALKALDYIHHMGYVHRCLLPQASHPLQERCLGS